jgi:two-component system LytT family response regulator
VSAAPARPLRVIVVDDEEPARRLLRADLARHDDVEVVAECANGFEAVQAVGQHEPDLLLLDVQMPKLDGFEVLELIDRPVSVIFITAFDEYAVRAFEVHAVDYLLKPVSADRLDAALERARARRPAPPPAALAEAARPPGRFRERILVRDGARVHVIPVDKLDYAEAQDDYVCLWSAGASRLKHQTLAELERELDPERFVRIHRSYLLNVERLARVEPFGKDSRIAVLRDGAQLPVSRTGYARLRERG